MIIEIKSGDYCAKIDSFGAELRALTCVKSGHEILWCGDNTVWKGVSPVLFPIVGSLKDKNFAVGGLLYKLERHGFARNLDWQHKQETENEAVFTLCHDEKTLEVYPFAFSLSAIFTLNNNNLTVCFTVCNKDDESLYYMLGAHTAFATEDGQGFSGCALRFENCNAEQKSKSLKSEGFIRRLNNSTGLLKKGESKLFDGDTLPLNSNLFNDDAVIFEKPLSKTVTLLREGTPYIQVDFNDFNVLGVWAARNTNRYVCIEPWTDVPTAEGETIVLADKPNVRTLKAGQTESFAYGITIL